MLSSSLIPVFCQIYDVFISLCAIHYANMCVDKFPRANANNNNVEKPCAFFIETVKHIFGAAFYANKMPINFLTCDEPINLRLKLQLQKQIFAGNEFFIGEIEK